MWRSKMNSSLSNLFKNTVLQMLAISALLAGLLALCNYAYFDNTSMFQDIGDDTFLVSLIASGQKMYYDFDVNYGPLAYLPIAQLQNVFKINSDDALQGYSLFGIWITYALFSMTALIYLRRRPLLFLLLGSVVVVFSLTRPNILLTWRIATNPALVLWICFVLLVANPLKFNDRVVVFIGLALSVLCFLTKQIPGLIMLSSLLCYIALKTLQRPVPWKRRMTRMIAIILAICALFVIGTMAIWAVTVSPEFLDGVMLRKLINVRVYQVGHELHTTGWNFVPVYFERWARAIQDGGLIGGGYAIFGDFGYLLNWLFKIILITVAVSYLWKTERPLLLKTGYISNNGILYIIVLYVNVVNGLTVEHQFQGAVDLVLTTISLIIVLGISEIRYPMVLGRVAAGLALLLLCGYTLFSARVAYKKLEGSELVRFNDQFAHYYRSDKGQSTQMRAFYESFQEAIPNMGRSRTWIIDEQSFLYYFLDVPLSVKHPYAYYGGVDPEAPGYDDYADKLQQQYFDYIIIGQDAYLFGRGTSRSLYSADRDKLPITVNHEIWNLIQSNYHIFMEIDRPGSSATYKLWEANRLSGR